MTHKTYQDARLASGRDDPFLEGAPNRSLARFALVVGLGLTLAGAVQSRAAAQSYPPQASSADTELAFGGASGLTPVFATVTSQGRVFSAHRGYYAMNGGRLEKWDFSPDGTFLHEGISAGAGTSVRGDARGIYRIEGNRLVLQIRKTTTAFATPGSEAHSTQLGASNNSASETVQMRIRLIGRDGTEGVVLNNVVFHIRHGW